MQIKKQFRTPDKLMEMVRNIKEIDAAVSNKKKSVAITNVGWISPISLLPLVVHSAQNGIKIRCSSKRKGVTPYLNRVCFPEGTEDLSEINANHLPITRFSCGLENPLLGKYEESIISKISPEYRNSFISGLKFLTSELQSNVEQHAKINHYWIFAQYWEKTKTCEICLADSGIGYMESYRGTKYEINDHSSAIKNAIQGLSSKTPDERGAGLTGIMKMFIDGYKGEMVILSGDSLLYLYSKKPIIYKCPINWKGAFVGLKFRLKDLKIEDYY